MKNRKKGQCLFTVPGVIRQDQSERVLHTYTCIHELTQITKTESMFCACQRSFKQYPLDSSATRNIANQKNANHKENWILYDTFGFINFLDQGLFSITCVHSGDFIYLEFGHCTLFGSGVNSHTLAQGNGRTRGQGCFDYG